MYIKCLDKGALESFDHPYELLKDRSTVFYELVHNLDKPEASRLIQTAKASYLKKNQQLKISYPINDIIIGNNVVPNYLGNESETEKLINNTD